MAEREIVIRRDEENKKTNFYGIKIVIDDMEYGIVKCGDQIKITLDCRSHRMYGLLIFTNVKTGKETVMKRYDLGEISATEDTLYYKVEAIYDPWQLALLSIKVKCTLERVEEKNADYPEVLIKLISDYQKTGDAALGKQVHDTVRVTQSFYDAGDVTYTPFLARQEACAAEYLLEEGKWIEAYKMAGDAEIYAEASINFREKLGLSEHVVNLMYADLYMSKFLRGYVKYLAEDYRGALEIMPETEFSLVIKALRANCIYQMQKENMERKTLEELYQMYVDVFLSLKSVPKGFWGQKMFCDAALFMSDVCERISHKEKAQIGLSKIWDLLEWDELRKAIRAKIVEIL